MANSNRLLAESVRAAQFDINKALSITEGATLYVYRRSFVRSLFGLKNAWDNEHRIRHAQASGFLLGELAANPVKTANTYLHSIIDFIYQQGPFGVDGILLSAMSAASILNKATFERAFGLCDQIAARIEELLPKLGLGIYFLDFGLLGDGAGLLGGLTSIDWRSLSENSFILSGFPEVVSNNFNLKML